MFKSKNLVMAILTIGMVALESATAQAAEFAFSYSGVGVDVTGILETDDLGVHTDYEGTSQPNTYLVTGITGQRNGVPISGLVTTGSAAGDEWVTAGGSFDNLLFPTVPAVDLGGILYDVGGQSYNIFYFDSSYRDLTLINGSFIPPVPGTPVSFNIAPVPEPITLGGTAVAGAMGWWIKRKKKASQTA